MALSEAGAVVVGPVLDVDPDVVVTVDEEVEVVDLPAEVVDVVDGGRVDVVLDSGGPVLGLGGLDEQAARARDPAARNRRVATDFRIIHSLVR